jgi:nitrite reductase/ring-hydroxylating ferredoxin subunit
MDDLPMAAGTPGADPASGSAPLVCPVARRAVLLGAGGAGLAALLTACGGGSVPAAQHTTGAPAGAGSPTGSTADPGELPTADPDAQEPDGTLVALADVPVGGGLITAGDVLVVQPRKGVVTAFDAHCTHQAILVGEPDASGVVTCPGHLSHFRAVDGARIDGPAPRGLAAVRVKVVQGYVVRA